MLDKTHLLYILISTLVGAALLTLLAIRRSRRQGRAVLAVLAVGTVLLHYSPLWVEYLQSGAATAVGEMLFLLYPCHICMWLLVLSVYFLEREGVLAQLLRDFTFWGGTVCATIGLLLNENYDSNPTLSDYSVLKGLLSHSTLIFGCILLLTSGHVRIRVGRGCAAVAAGLTLFLADGLLVNWLFARFGLPTPNAMYLEELPFPSLPWLNTATIGLAAMLTVFLVSAIFEEIALPREERWHARLIAQIKKRNNTEKRRHL